MSEDLSKIAHSTITPQQRRRADREKEPLCRGEGAERGRSGESATQ